MRFSGKKIGFALTGSHCTIPDVLPELERIVAEGADVYPIVSDSVRTTDTRFGKAEEILSKIAGITGKEPIYRIVDAEPIGPKKLLDCLVIAPCTGNTLAKLANGITDTAVLMAAKAQLRNERPVVIAVSTNDALSGNAVNIGVLFNRKNIYLVPFGQDNPKDKAASLVADMSMIPDTIEASLMGIQIQPVIIERY